MLGSCICLWAGAGAGARRQGNAQTRQASDGDDDDDKRAASARGARQQRQAQLCSGHPTPGPTPHLQHDHLARVVLPLADPRGAHAKEERRARRHVGTLCLQRRYQGAGGGEAAAHGDPGQVVCGAGAGQQADISVRSKGEAYVCEYATRYPPSATTVHTVDWPLALVAGLIKPTAISGTAHAGSPAPVASEMLFCSCCTSVTRPTGDRSTLADTWDTMKRCTGQ